MSTIFVSIVVSIPACHAGDRDSIPQQRVNFFSKHSIAEAIDWNPSKIIQPSKIVSLVTIPINDFGY